MDISSAWMLWAVTMIMVCYQAAEAASKCSWSNEDCSHDADCCSQSCHKAHEGTNARCRHSTLGEPCVFDYHCQDSLTCGPHYNCCSPYWKMCITDDDCCEYPAHVCKSADGFFYDRCLMRGGATTATHLRHAPASLPVALLLAAMFSADAIAQFIRVEASAVRTSLVVVTSVVCFVAFGTGG